jgi:hypothetical protein
MVTSDLASTNLADIDEHTSLISCVIAIYEVPSQSPNSFMSEIYLKMVRRKLKNI